MLKLIISKFNLAELVKIKVYMKQLYKQLYNYIEKYIFYCNIQWAHYMVDIILLPTIVIVFFFQNALNLGLNFKKF